MENKILTFLQKIYFPESIFLGKQASLFLGTIKEKKNLVITSDFFKKANGKLLAGLFPNGRDYFFQDREPKVEDFNKLKEYCLSGEFDYLIAVGGGSVMDLVKLVKKELGVKMVAIPTTIGSGAEVSQHALLIDNGEKKVFSSPEFLPETVILDIECLKSLAKEQLIFQSIDALSHGLESLVSRISNPLSDRLSLISIEIIYENLNKIDKEEDRVKVLEDLQIAGILAGISQSSAATGLCHALAHYFGAKNSIRHSEAVAIFLLDVLELNSKHTDKYKKLDQLKNLSSDNFLQKFQELFNELGLLKDKKINFSETLEKTAEIIKKDISLLTNPYSPSIEDIIGILKKHQ